MSNSLTIIEPGKKVDNNQRETMLGYIKDSKNFLKAAGYTEKYIKGIKVKDLQDINKKASDKITIDSFENWVESGIKKEAVVRRLWRKFSEPFLNVWESFTLLFKKKNKYY